MLLPAGTTASEEPDWLRAAEMIEQEAACPGERLFARSLATAAHWCRADELAAAARSFAAALPAGNTLAATPFIRDAVLHGCAAVATAAEHLPAAHQARLIGF